MGNLVEKYLNDLRTGLEHAYAVASEARKQGFDPTDDVEVKIAKDVAARVEGIVGPPGIALLIRSMEAGGMVREDIAFEVARKIAAGEVFRAGKEKLIEQAVRTGLGILTEGVLVAPTEGIAKVKIKTNPDGSDYVAVYYAGPIRSAGGTAAALSLVLADIARKVCNVGDYRATDSQIERYYEEIMMYETRVTHLQYMPSEEDAKVIAANCPVCIDGEPTEDLEVSAHRGVPGVETDRIRGGVPLVLCEGVASKAAKLFKYTKKLKLGWDWLEKIIKIKKKLDKLEVKPDNTYLEGLVAGRPVFSHPSAKGGFRLRYGRSKTNGLMAKDMHPATMILLENFIAYGTHMKIERPGKGCVMGANADLEPPVVKLKSGRVMKVRSSTEARALHDDIIEILFLGDILCTYGDFLKSNHPLIPSGYCSEWWEREVEAKGIALPGHSLDAKFYFDFSRTYGLPLHPNFTFHWHDLSFEQLNALVQWLKKATFTNELSIPYSESASSTRSDFDPIQPSVVSPKRALEELLVEHRVHDGNVILEKNDGFALLSSLGVPLVVDESGKAVAPFDFSAFDKSWSRLNVTPQLSTAPKNTLEFVNELAGIVIRPKAPTYIGGRMGRPEKAKERKMDGSPHALFPTGSFKNRSLMKQYRTIKSREGEKTINLELSRMRCKRCKRLTFYRKCDVCGERAIEEKVCQKCGRTVEFEMHCDMETLGYDRRPIDIVELMEGSKVDIGGMDEIKGVKGLSNPTRIPERLEKGVLRAKHDVYVFRDGTCRFDATDIPLTHFAPIEIGLSVQRAIELGYVKDYLGNPLTDGKQIVTLKHQDILLSEDGMVYMSRVADFIDGLLVNLYGLPPFYKIRDKEDLIGHLGVGLSPHTSAGALCRIIGFTKANVGYGHPYFHTAKRRNCDGDEDSVMLLMDALLNFSRKFLNETRGGTMDAPLVLSIEINPKEVDDEAHCIELVSKYPLEFYQAAERITPPGDVKIKTVKDVLGELEQYEFTLTHPGGTLDEANNRTTYVTLDSIPDKIDIQFRLQEKLRPVDKRDAAERLILSHFIPDLYGNLRSFSRQTFRCVSCNGILRRVPLAGKCPKCGGNLLLTINKGGIEKYLQISRDIVEKYKLPVYLKQRLELVEKEIRSIFEDDKIKQMGLSDFL